MKKLLGFGIFLLCVHLIAAAPVIKRYAEKPDLRDFNALRREIAQLGRLNVPDLEYDYNLEAVAKGLSNDCNRIDNGPNYRVMPEGPDPNAVRMIVAYYIGLFAIANADELPLTAQQRIQVQQAKAEFEAGLRKGSALHFELLNPLQTKIGCALSRCTGVIPSEIDSSMKATLGIVGTTYSFDYMCVLGPSGDWPMDRLSGIQHASAKSQTIQHIVDDKQMPRHLGAGGDYAPMEQPQAEPDIGDYTGEDNGDGHNQEYANPTRIPLTGITSQNQIPNQPLGQVGPLPTTTSSAEPLNIILVLVISMVLSLFL